MTSFTIPERWKDCDKRNDYLSLNEIKSLKKQRHLPDMSFSLTLRKTLCKVAQSKD